MGIGVDRNKGLAHGDEPRPRDPDPRGVGCGRAALETAVAGTVARIDLRLPLPLRRRRPYPPSGYRHLRDFLSLSLSLLHILAIFLAKVVIY